MIFFPKIRLPYIRRAGVSVIENNSLALKIA